MKINIISIVILLSMVITGLILSGCDNSVDSKGARVDTPDLISPPDRDTSTTLTPLFTWGGLANKIEIATDQGFVNVIHSAELSASPYQIQDSILKPYTQYYWHAGAYAYSSLFWSSDIYNFCTGGH